MFLSDTLEDLYSKDPGFNPQTCIDIARAVMNKVQEEMGSLVELAHKRGAIKSSVAYSVIDRQENIFQKFCKRHPDIPEPLVNYVTAKLDKDRTLITKIVDGKFEG